MLRDVVSARHLGGHRLHLTFEDGVQGEVNLTELVAFEGVFEPLRDAAEVGRVRTERGTVTWPCGADLDPDVLYARVAGMPVPGAR